MAEHNFIGRKGEQLALHYLKSKGYSILHCNWRFQKAEIDLIAEIDKTLVIVEVKTRTSEEFELPQKAVTISKQRQLIKAAEAYIEEYDIHYECRFDVLSILMLGEQTRIDHIEDAFQPLL